MEGSPPDKSNKDERRQSVYQVEEKISHYLDQDVAQIINTFQDGKFVVATGQPGIGKTEILVPQLKKSLLRKKYNAYAFTANSSQFDSRSTRAYVEGIQSYARGSVLQSDSNNGVLVADEAGFMNRSIDESGIKEILNIFRQRGFTLIPVIAYTAGNEAEEAAVWQKLGTEVYGKKAVVHTINPDMPPDLIERYLSANEFRKTNFSPEEVQTIMQILPPRLQLLSRMRSIIGEKISPAEFIKSEAWKWRMDGIITTEEERYIYDKLEELKH